MRDLHVNASQMTSCVSSIEAACRALSDGAARLDGLCGRLQSSSTMSQDSDADNKFESCRSRWKDEFEILADMFDKFKGAVSGAARVYGEVDGEIGRAIRGGGGGSSPPG